MVVELTLDLPDDIAQRFLGIADKATRERLATQGLRQQIEQLDKPLEREAATTATPAFSEIPPEKREAARTLFAAMNAGHQGSGERIRREELYEE